MAADGHDQVELVGEDGKPIENVPADSAFRSYLANVTVREAGYVDSLRSQRYEMSNPVDVPFQPPDDFTETAPQILIQMGDAPNLNWLVLRSILLSIKTIGGGGPIEVAVVIDSVPRYVSGGTTRIPRNPNASTPDATSAVETREGNIVATASGATAKQLPSFEMINVAGNTLTAKYKDEVLIPPDGTLLIYIKQVTAPSSPTMNYGIAYADVQINPATP